jgi:hypothetical protein
MSQSPLMPSTASAEMVPVAPPAVVRGYAHERQVGQGAVDLGDPTGFCGHLGQSAWAAFCGPWRAQI